MIYPTPAEFVAHGLSLPIPTLPVYDLPGGVHCAITGQPIIRGVAVSDVVTDATAEFLDCFRGGVHGYISVAAAQCFKNADPRQGNPTARSMLLFEDVGWTPMISRESATAQGRACWSDLVREVWPARQGQNVLAILTTDQKKRLWPRARIGTLGERTPMFCYDADTNLHDLRFISWPRLIECLDIIEVVYTAGFSKVNIAVSLLAQTKAVEANGLHQVLRWELALAQIHERPEFLPALLMAQKKETEDDRRTRYDLRDIANGPFGSVTP